MHFGGGARAGAGARARAGGGGGGAGGRRKEEEHAKNLLARLSTGSEARTRETECKRSVVHVTLYMSLYMYVYMATNASPPLVSQHLLGVNP